MSIACKKCSSNQLVKTVTVLVSSAISARDAVIILLREMTDISMACRIASK